MIEFGDKNIHIIPWAYRIFEYNYKYNSKNVKFPTNILLDTKDIIKLIEEIEKIESEIIVAIDMSYIGSYYSRAFNEFNKLGYKKRQCFFYNLNVLTDLKGRLIEDIKDVYNDNGNYKNYDDKVCFDKDMFKKIIGNEYLITKIETIISNKIFEIVDSVTQSEIQFLDSSGVFSNKYVDLKRLFLKTEPTYFILYEMANIVYKEFKFADALISTSKAGAVLASLIGQILGIKVVHCIGVGPKFSLPIDEVKKNIRAGKKYVAICDFICLGTELKILNALIISEKAELIGGIATSSYVNLRNEELNGSILSKVKSLINIREHQMDYKIGIDKSELTGV